MASAARPASCRAVFTELRQIDIWVGKERAHQRKTTDLIDGVSGQADNARCQCIVRYQQQRGALLVHLPPGLARALRGSTMRPSLFVIEVPLLISSPSMRSIPRLATTGYRYLLRERRARHHPNTLLGLRRGGIAASRHCPLALAGVLGSRLAIRKIGRWL
ncbi:MAG: hypothetical protein LC644_02510 [Pseudonocardia sp.]|nr:hypothetical protein [Pseudonocardia sp.]